MKTTSICPETGKVSFSKKDAQTSCNLRRNGRTRVGMHRSSTPWRTARNKRNTSKEMRIYQCPYCNYWHITHKPR